MQNIQPTARSSRFRGVEIRKKSAGRRLRRRPWIYVISAGNDGARIKRSMGLPLLYWATPNALSGWKKRYASASKLPAANIFLLYGQYLNLPVTNNITGNQYLLYNHCPDCPCSAPTSRGRVFCIEKLFICNILYIYIYYILYIVYFIIFILYPQRLPQVPRHFGCLYREIKRKKNIFFLFLFSIYI